MALLSKSNYKKFMLAGKAIFTLRSTRTGQRFTYKIKVADNDNNYEHPLYFVSVLVGPDNWTNYRFFGTIKGENKQFTISNNAKISPDAPSVRGFKWAWEYLDQLPDFMEIWHEGKCGRCGRKLTVPESIESGFGPECINMV